MKESYKFFSYLRGVIDIVVFNGAFFIAYYLKFDQLPNFSKPNQMPCFMSFQILYTLQALF